MRKFIFNYLSNYLLIKFLKLSSWSLPYRQKFLIFNFSNSLYLKITFFHLFAFSFMSLKQLDKIDRKLQEWGVKKWHKLNICESMSKFNTIATWKYFIIIKIFYIYNSIRKHNNVLSFYCLQIEIWGHNS